TGAILFALSVVALELRLTARRLASDRSVPDFRAKTALSSPSASSDVPEDGGPEFDPPYPARAEIDASRVSPVDASEPAPAASSSPPKPKRNLLFQSNMRRDRERAEARLAETAQQAPTDVDETLPGNIGGVWPRRDRARSGQAPSSRRRLAPSAEANA